MQLLVSHNFLFKDTHKIYPFCINVSINIDMTQVLFMQSFFMVDKSTKFAILFQATMSYVSLTIVFSLLLEFFYYFILFYI